MQIGWIARLAIEPGSPWLVASFVVLAAAELVVPVLAERGHGYALPPRHIAERYGLLTIIVLGEVILASVLAIQGAMASTLAGGSGGHTAPAAAGPAGGGGLTWAMAPLILGGLLVVFALWWLYFSRDHATIVENPRAVWLFGYGHLPIFASVAAVGAALAAGVDVVGVVGCRRAADRSRLAGPSRSCATSRGAALGSRGPCTMVPAVVVSVLCLAVALAVPSMGVAVLLMGLVLSGLVAQRCCRFRRRRTGRVRIPGGPGTGA